MTPNLTLAGYKTYLAAAGLLGLALYQATEGQWEQAAQSFSTALGLLGLRAAIG